MPRARTAPDFGSDMFDSTRQDVANGMVCSGRSTLYCCLSCGMPFSFPDDAYTSGDKDVKEMLLFVHKIRDEIKKANEGKKSTMMWQVCCRTKSTDFALYLCFSTITQRGTHTHTHRPTSATTCTSSCTPTSLCTCQRSTRDIGRGWLHTPGPARASPRPRSRQGSTRIISPST